MYFDDTNNYFEYNKTNDIDFKINNINFNREIKLYDLEEGFNKGNIFNNLYSKYKNHVYKLKVNNEKDELLYKIQAYTFAIKDMILYLDIYPTNNEILKLYKEYNEKLNVLKSKYEYNYGPLCSFNINSSKWTWIDSPWPWDKGGSK